MHTLLRRGAVGLSMFALVALLALTTQVRDTQAGLATYAFDDTAPFAWTDISGTGASLAGLNGCDDCAQANVPIGFTFNFAGTDYTMLEPTTNGVISLDQEGNTEYENSTFGPLPTGEWTGAALFPFWDDLDPGITGTMYSETIGTAPNRAFIVQYDGVTHIDSEDPAYVITFQALLCEGSNNIVFQYLDAVFGDPLSPENDNGGDATVGVQASSASAAQYSHLSAAIMNNMAIVVYPTSGSSSNCLAGAAPTPTTPIAPTDTPGPAAPTDTPVAPAPTSTAAAVALPATGASGGSTDGSGWLITALAFVALAAGLGYAAVRLRTRRA